MQIWVERQTRCEQGQSHCRRRVSTQARKSGDTIPWVHCSYRRGRGAALTDTAGRERGGNLAAWPDSQLRLPGAWGSSSVMCGLRQVLLHFLPALPAESQASLGAPAQVSPRPSGHLGQRTSARRPPQTAPYLQTASTCQGTASPTAPARAAPLQSPRRGKGNNDLFLVISRTSSLPPGGRFNEYGFGGALLLAFGELG